MEGEVVYQAYPGLPTETQMLWLQLSPNTAGRRTRQEPDRNRLCPQVANAKKWI